jgi:predicted acetyltransferase
MSFEFLDPGPLIDAELELVVPEHRWVGRVLQTCRHPRTAAVDPDQACTTRSQLLEFLKAAPQGRLIGNPSRGRAPAYHFWMSVTDNPNERLSAQFEPLSWSQRLLTAPQKALWGAVEGERRIAGGIGLRIGDSEELRLYSGHIGYHVYPPFRGRHYAERSCRLLLPLARQHGLTHLWITCNPDNIASRRTCERLGARLVDTVPIPPSHPFHARGEREKCRFVLEL